jgi:hypothetical protein
MTPRQASHRDATAQWAGRLMRRLRAAHYNSGLSRARMAARIARIEEKF